MVEPTRDAIWQRAVLETVCPDCVPPSFVRTAAERPEDVMWGTRGLNVGACPAGRALCDGAWEVFNRVLGQGYYDK